MRRLMGVMGAVALMTGMLVAGAGPASASGARTAVVRPGQSIQAAIDAASPGGTILVRPGTYSEHLSITKGVHIVGFGATLAAPATSGLPTPCSAPAPSDDGICIAGDFTTDPNTGAVTVSRYVQDVRITGLTVAGFEGSGIDQIGGQGSRFIGINARNNGEYGIAAFDSTGTTELLNTATNSAEAGFYIGDSPQANATLVGNQSSGNLFGFFIRDAQHGTITANRAHDNCVGVLFLADAPGPDGAFHCRGEQHPSQRQGLPGERRRSAGFRGWCLHLRGSRREGRRERDPRQPAEWSDPREWWCSRDDGHGWHCPPEQPRAGQRDRPQRDRHRVGRDRNRQRPSPQLVRHE